MDADGGDYQVIVPSLDDMDEVVLGGSIAAIYSNPGYYPNVNTRAMQFVKFMMDYQIMVNAVQVVVKPLDDMASYVQ